MALRTAKAVWEGPVKTGHGTIALESGLLDTSYSFGSRFGTEAGTNPEELLGAAAAGCFTMALSLALSALGHPPARITTTARVAIEKEGDGFQIPEIVLQTRARVPGIDAGTFLREAEKAKAGCPVSKALAATKIVLDADLED